MNIREFGSKLTDPCGQTGPLFTIGCSVHNALLAAVKCGCCKGYRLLALIALAGVGGAVSLWIPPVMAAALVVYGLRCTPKD
jgi:hypothetical protein